MGEQSRWQQRGDKSGAVRELLEQNPEMVATAIASNLAARGIKINPNLVYYVKAQLKKSRKGQKTQAVPQASRNGGSNAVQLVRSVKDLAEQAGGMKELAGAGGGDGGVVKRKRP